MKKLTVVLADAHSIVRCGLRLLIDAQPDMAVSAEVSDCAAAIEKIAERTPDAVVMAYSMAGENTASAIEAMRRRSPEVRVLVLTGIDDPICLSRVMQAGAAGYVHKRSDAERLLSAIRSVHRGELFMDPSVQSVDRQQPIEGAASSVDGPHGGQRYVLTEREQQVLQLVADGHTNQEVADRLFLSVKTIETHRSRLMRKLGASSRAELTRYARQGGIQSVPVRAQVQRDTAG